MNPDDIVLVALLNTPRDYEIVARERWYRIPAHKAPKYFSNAQYVAFYLPRAFGERKWTIDTYASVRGYELVRRRDLLPAESDHPRADEPYLKLQLGPLQKREPPIRSKRGRRILFVWTTWEKFTNAVELNDLFVRTPAHEKLWTALQADQLDVEREMIVREGRSRYRVDFLIYLPTGQLAVTLGAATQPPRRTESGYHLDLAEEEVENHLPHAMQQIRHLARELEGNAPYGATTVT